MATKKRATKKSTGIRSSKDRSRKVEQSIFDGESPIIGGDSPPIIVDYVLPPDMPLLYADSLNIIHTQSEFIISFLQVNPPLVTGEEDWSKIKSIESRCIARIIISPMKMQSLLQVLFMNWQRYSNKYLVEEGADATESDTKTDDNRK